MSMVQGAAPAVLESAAATDGQAFARAAQAVRDRDLAGVRAALEPLLADGPDAGRARLTLGLAAHALENVSLAVEVLAGVESPEPDLEDWRLFVLADSLAAQGILPAARAALDRLIRERATSPLREAALLRAVELARRAGDLPGAWERIGIARGSLAETATRLEIEEIAWQIARDGRLGDERRELARHFLVEHPLAASKLRVVDALRATDGSMDWAAAFTAEELRRRARRLLDIDLTDSAGDTLDQVPAGYRGSDWILLEVETLTRQRRGAEALVLLNSSPLPPRTREADYLWWAAQAGLGAATVRPGRANLPSERRQALRVAAVEDLWRLAHLNTDVERSREALRSIYHELDLDEHFEDALRVLRWLRELEPGESYGAPDLWRVGWDRYRERDLTGAIGVFRELEVLYPDSSYSRRGRYWSARAHERLGDGDRAREIYRQLLDADTLDFYALHAARRLGVAPQPGDQPAIVQQEWPRDRHLARAELLFELGLDDLVLRELDLARPGADARAADALESLALERKGERRESIHALARTFGTLGSSTQAGLPATALRMYYPLDFEELVRRWATQHGLAPNLVFGIIRQESAFDSGAISRSGARGLMQLMPATGQELARNLRLSYSKSRLNDPEFSIRLGTSYFSRVLQMFDGNVELALAGYNGGPYRVRRWWRDAGPDAELDEFIEGLPLQETAGYVKRILVFEDSYRQLYGT